MGVNIAHPVLFITNDAVSEITLILEEAFTSKSPIKG